MTNTVLITGAATGIGRATARRLSQLGWRVFASLLPEQARDFERSPTLIPMVMDVTDAASVTDAVSLVSDQLGRNGLSALVNNAGVAHLGTGPVAGCSLSETEALLRINVLGTLRVTQAFLPLLHRSEDARIVNVTSGAVDVPVPFSATYNMSKAAIEGLTRTLRLELAPFGIQTTSIRPGAVRSPMTDGAAENIRAVWDRMPRWVREVYEPVLEPANRALIASIARANPPERIADAIAHALSSRKMSASYLVGHEVRLLPIAKALLTEGQLERVLLRQLGLAPRSVGATRVELPARAPSVEAPAMESVS